MSLFDFKRRNYGKLIGKVLPNQNILDCSEISGKGKNSKVFVVSLHGSEKLLLKFYPQNSSDKRERLKTEYSAFQALWNNKVRCIPKPFTFNYEINCAAYSHIRGEANDCSNIKFNDISQASEFIKYLKKLSANYPVETFSKASEACFSLEELFLNIDSRLLALSSTTSFNKEKDFKNFILKLSSYYQEIKSYSLEELEKIPLKPKTVLTQDLRILSPSDFGFHNAILDQQGKWNFIDFEYFGWDDPVKLIIDFILHPGMSLNTNLSQCWINQCSEIFADYPALDLKLRAYFPLLGIKWCCIILNCFLPEKQKNLSENELRELKLKQLAKADNMLNNVKNKCYSFMLKDSLEERIQQGRKLSIAKLDERSIELRKTIINTALAGGRGHIGPALSLVEILRVLYDSILSFDPKNPRKESRDRLILSKGHGCLALYAILADKGFFPQDALDTYCKFESFLGGHPEYGKVPGVEASTGSLGHGLSIGIGMALAAKIDKKSHRVFTILGDGESTEGSNWEAALHASKHQLDNLTVIVDYNKQASYGSTYEIVDLEPFADKWRAFGFAVKEVDGHDISLLKDVFTKLPNESGKPSLILCHTVKGRGLKEAENNPSWHHKAKITKEEVDRLLKILSGE